MAAFLAFFGFAFACAGRFAALAFFAGAFLAAALGADFFFAICAVAGTAEVWVASVATRSASSIADVTSSTDAMPLTPISMPLPR